MATRNEVIATKERSALICNIKEVLSRGEKIVVVGWRDSNHNAVTKRLAKTGTVDFVLDPPGCFSSNIGKVICTRFIQHAKFHQLRKKSDLHPVVLSNGEIKRTLALCEDTFPNVQIRTTENRKNVPVDLTLPVAKPQLIESPILPKTEEIELDAAPLVEKLQGSPDMELFVRMFHERAILEDGLVGKRTLGTIRQACGLQSQPNGTLVKRGYLIPVKSEGRKNAGRYRAGEKMNGVNTLVSQSQDVSDPLIKARMIISQEEDVRTQIIHVSAKLEELKRTLDKIGAAKDLVQRIEQMFV